MTGLRAALDVRREEFDAHFELAKALEDRMVLDATAAVGTVSLSVRHVNTLKSGLLVHLYTADSFSQHIADEAYLVPAE